MQIGQDLNNSDMKSTVDLFSFQATTHLTEMPETTQMHIYQMFLVWINTNPKGETQKENEILKSKEKLSIHIRALSGNCFSQHRSYGMLNIFVLLDGWWRRLLAPTTLLSTAWTLRQAGSTNILFLQSNPTYQFQKKNFFFCKSTTSRSQGKQHCPSGWIRTTT